MYTRTSTPRTEPGRCLLTIKWPLPFATDYVRTGIPRLSSHYPSPFVSHIKKCSVLPFVIVDTQHQHQLRQPNPAQQWPPSSASPFSRSPTKQPEIVCWSSTRSLRRRLLRCVKPVGFCLQLSNPSASLGRQTVHCLRRSRTDDPGPAM
jgi:hypothetical protein